MKALVFVLAAVAAIAFAPSSHAAGEDLVIGRMKVTIMPEYDSQAVLVIQEGKFADKRAFPSGVTFLLPREVTKLTDVCSLSPGGHHFCQLFDIQYGKDANYINIKLPYADFFIDYQYAPFTARENTKREFTYTVDTSHEIRSLEVHIQEPFRAKEFSVTPSTDDVYEKDGFRVFRFKEKDVKKGEPRVFKISYFKADAKPSVDIKFSAMSSPGIFKKNTGELILGAGLAALLVIWVVRRRSARSRG